MNHYVTCLKLTWASARLRAHKLADSTRLAWCLLGDHRFEPDGHRCTRCDAARVEHWGHWVVVDG